MTALLDAANRHASAMAWMLSLAAALPALSLLYDASQGRLGPNPLDTLTRESGRWTYLLLIATLALTPLRHAAAFAARRPGTRFGRRPADWNWIVRLRRPMGLACFCYAAAHASIYLILDAGFDPRAVLADLREKPYLGVGMSAFALLLPLAATSTDASMRRLKRTWKRLHRAVYAIGVLAALHFIWLSKPGLLAPYLYAGAVSVLLGYRLALWAAAGMRSTDALGEVAPERRPARQGQPGRPHPAN